VDRQLAYNTFIQQALKYGFSLFGVTKSGQITSFADGDDGYYQKGYPQNGVRFVDNGDGTITDMATGLMWIKDPSQIGGDWGSPGSPTTTTWAVAITRCNALEYAGYSDWRLPNIKELYSIVDIGEKNPSINNIYDNTIVDNYWSSSTKKNITSYKWVVVFDFGSVGTKAGSGSAYARPVRLGG